MALAERLERLGTETAFTVSLAAAEWAAKGNRIYPFHLGDLDLATPANVVAAMDRAIADGKTGYCPAAGIPQLREALADDIGGRRGLQYSPAQRRRPARRQAGDHQVHPGGDEPRRRGALPEPRLPDLREPDRVLRRRGQGRTATSRRRPASASTSIRSRRSITPKTTGDHLQRSAEPDRRRESTDAEREAIAEMAIEQRPLGAHRRGVLRDALLRNVEVDRIAARACRSAPSSCTRSRRSSR